MEAKSTDRKTVQLTGDGELLGELHYQNFLFLKAEIKLDGSGSYEVKPVGFFGTSIAVMKAGEEIASLKMSWRGYIVFTFKNGPEYVLKPKGPFYNKFILENEAEEKLIQFNPKFNWNRFDYNYDISYEKKPRDILLVLLGVYASNYFVATMSGATGGIG